ncbi:hypothetical protein OG552_30025 [Streptomyces sp. NBC_01476]|uniref:hypothetical protein n=1 Tax=Streptomyces sp. NBC_01476 TaxID=2903881 RepID=UPI002E2FB818|nr:hypothetical protein [Streptomyces sp. NBC_01476]
MLLTAGSRPASPRYQQLSLVTGETAHQMLLGRRDIDAGVHRLAADLRDVLSPTTHA